MFVVGVGAEGDAAGAGCGGGGEGDFEPVAAGGGGDDEVGREGCNEFAETGEFGGVGGGAVGEGIEGGGEEFEAGREERREAEVGAAEEYAEARIRPGSTEGPERGRRENEVAEGVEFEQQRGARGRGGDGHGHGAGAGTRSSWRRRPVRRRVSGAGSGKSAGAASRRVCAAVDAGTRRRRVA